MGPLPDSCVERMPCDPDLLIELGRVTWAAARLHAGARDAINHHDGVSSNEPFTWTLGKAVATLERRATTAGRLDQARWAQDYGRPAVARRNAVVHAVTFTATNGRQAIGTVDHAPPGRFLAQDLRDVTLALIEASMNLPQ